MAPTGFLGPGMGLEVLYSFLIIVCSLMIYFGTKELYELSSHEGIRYFRQAFLFFAIAYFVRYFIKFIILGFEIPGLLQIPPIIGLMLLGFGTLISFMYFSSMAIFYLLYSVMWKKWKSRGIYYFHTLAGLIALMSIIFMSPLFYLIINIILLIFVIIVVIISSKNRHKSKFFNLYVIYLLLFIFWILNILDILIPDFIRTFQLFIYLASSGIFLTILYKVIKKTV